MPYKYEVFISYRHENPAKDWVRDWFFTLFRDYFEALMPTSDCIFIDNNSIKTGLDWDAKLKDALLHSKLMISIWTPKYFNNDSYAIRELAFMYNRQKQLGLDIDNSLIIPIRLTGDYETTSPLQYLDYYQHWRRPTGPPPKKLENEIKRLAEQIYLKLEKVPDWHDELASEHWLTESESRIGQLRSIYKPYLGCPSIA